MSDDGSHEGYLTVVFADGIEGRSSSVLGVSVGYADDGSELIRPHAAVTGWRLCCDHRGRGRWTGSEWTRVLARESEDLGSRRLFCTADDVSWVMDARPDVEVVIGAEWLAHIAPDEALAEVREAAGAARAAELQLERAVVSARLAGASWTAVGEATGMARQSAHERWAARVPQM